MSFFLFDCTKNRVVLLCLLLSSLLPAKKAIAQLTKSYVAAPVLDTIPSGFLKKSQARLKSDQSKVNEPKSQVNGYAKELYEKRTDYLIQNFNADFFILDSAFTPYLQSILNKIYQANPQLDNQATVFAYRSAVPNAISFGEGTIAFTLGLLARMESEDQIAYVLCHELAHYHNRHSDLSIIEFARLNYDKEIRKKVKKISRSEYGRFTKYSALSNTLGLSINKHSREKEFEADSLALMLYINTDFNRKAPLRVMDILDSADISLSERNIAFKKHFSFQEYPFKETWLDYSKSTTWHKSPDSESDSLRTHPGCELRKVALQRQLEKINHAAGSSLNEPNQMRDAGKFEIIESDYHYSQYGEAMFNALLLSEQYPDNAYLHAMINKCLYRIYQGQKNHELGKMVQLPDPRFSENYDRYLTFIQALRLTEVASLSYYYGETNQKYIEEEEYLYSYWLSNHSELSSQSTEKIKKEYERKFPNGKYIKKFN